MSKPILLSGTQPSGHLMIGNYLGAIKQWVNLQDDYQCLFPLVDLHAISVKQPPEALRQRGYEFVALYLASGLDPEKSTIFVQSHVPQHTQFSWILNCYTYMGELNRMTQFKDKSQKNASNINAGLFSYPVLMAADILIYQANLVPVGEDQKQHLELCRNLAERINNEYATEDKPLLTLPEPFIPARESGGRIMALQNPTSKMSKSDENSNNVIFLLDDAKTIEKKIKRSVTDSGSDIRYDLENKVGISNLLTLLSLVSNNSIDDLVLHYTNKGYGHLKVDLVEALTIYLKPLQDRYKTFISDKHGIDFILKKGAEQASERAQRTVDSVSYKIGLINKI